MSHLGVLVRGSRMGLVSVRGRKIDENGIEERRRDISSYEMRAKSHILRNLIVPLMSTVTMPLSVPFFLQSFVPFLESTRDDHSLSNFSLIAGPTYPSQ